TLYTKCNLIFGMHVYLMELHILSDEKSRSSFKVKECIGARDDMFVQRVVQNLPSNRFDKTPKKRGISRKIQV
ncbi:hypothetical protein DPMN_091798, partial [Dreissena polymorpha]